MNLKHLTDSTLLKDTKYLASRERELTVQILHHIKEIDRRKLYSDLKYSSLYEYCIRELNYSEASAQRRISGARMLKDLPEIEAKIESGEISLTNLELAGKFMKDNDIKEPKKKKEILKQIENMSKKECDQKLFELSGQERPRLTTLTIKDETFVLLQKVRDLSGKYLNNDELLTLMSEQTILKIEKEKFKQTASRKSPPPAEVKRVIPSNLKRIVYLRDKKCVKCGSVHKLNYDHRKPYALGGKTNAENIRLLCFNCNQRSRIKAKL